MSISEEDKTVNNRIPTKNNKGEARIHPKSADDILNRQYYNFSLKTIKAMMRPKEYKSFVERYVLAKASRGFIPKPEVILAYDEFMSGKIGFDAFRMRLGKKLVTSWCATSKLGGVARYVTEQKYGRK